MKRIVKFFAELSRARVGGDCDSDRWRTGTCLPNVVRWLDLLLLCEAVLGNMRFY
jgi:hypothetical protein